MQTALARGARAFLPATVMTMEARSGEAAVPVIILRSESPLPKFCVPFPIPPRSSDIALLRLSVLRILSGQNMAEATRPLTYSEQLKQVTIQSWRLKMLELIQVQGGSAAPVDDEITLGLPLEDEHKCSALEHGDEIVVRLRNGYTIQELALPPLPANYDYAAAVGSHGTCAP